MTMKPSAAPKPFAPSAPDLRADGLFCGAMAFTSPPPRDTPNSGTIDLFTGHFSLRHTTPVSGAACRFVLYLYEPLFYSPNKYSQL